MDEKPYDLATITSLVDGKKMYSAIKSCKADDRKKILESGELTLHGFTMRFFYKKVGTKPTEGYPLYFGLHGGGGCNINEEQYNNHKHLYEIDCGIWFAPRAPEDSWNMWHKWYIDDMIDFIIASFVLLDEVNPNKVFLTGYSAGGDGVYKLAPRMADRFSGCAMMAGHPNGADMISCRNIFMSLQVGGDDSAYERNKICKEYGEKLKALKANDQYFYDHFVEVHEGKGHWMEMADAQVFPMLAQTARNPYPNKVVWRTCKDVLEPTFYWLGLPKEVQDYDKLVVASKKGNTFTVTSSDFEKVVIFANRELVDDFESPLIFNFLGKEFTVNSYIENVNLMVASIEKRFDPNYIWSLAFSVSANGVEILDNFDFNRKV